MKAECAWGDGPDVLLSLDGSDMFLLERVWKHPPPHGTSIHGHVSEGQVDLNKDEAIKLAHELIAAANEADRLDNIGEGK